MFEASKKDDADSDWRVVYGELSNMYEAVYRCKSQREKYRRFLIGFSFRD